MVKSGSLIVRHHSPLRQAIQVALIVALIGGGGFGLFYWGQSQAGYDFSKVRESAGGLKVAIRELERQNLELREQVALLERSTQMDKQAYDDVNVNIKSLQEEVLELREEVAFYRGIIAPNETSSGLRVERFELNKARGEARLYHFKLVLTQVLKNHRNAGGSVTLFVDGVQNGTPRRLDLRTVSAQKQSSMGFKFRYFQKLEGDLLLPDGFLPRSVEVSVESGGKGKPLTRSFDWPGADGIATPQGEQADTSNEGDTSP